MNIQYLQPRNIALRRRLQGRIALYLMITDIVIAFVYALSIRSIAQSIGDVLYIWYSVHDSADWPVGISTRNRFQVDCVVPLSLYEIKSEVIYFSLHCMGNLVQLNILSSELQHLMREASSPCENAVKSQTKKLVSESQEKASDRGCLCHLRTRSIIMSCAVNQESLTGNTWS
jgi:hypothetical protein